MKLNRVDDRFSNHKKLSINNEILTLRRQIFILLFYMSMMYNILYILVRKIRYIRSGYK